MPTSCAPCPGKSHAVGGAVGEVAGSSDTASPPARSRCGLAIGAAGPADAVRLVGLVALRTGDQLSVAARRGAGVGVVVASWHTCASEAVASIQSPSGFNLQRRQRRPASIHRRLRRRARVQSRTIRSAARTHRTSHFHILSHGLRQVESDRRITAKPARSGGGSITVPVMKSMDGQNSSSKDNSRSNSMSSRQPPQRSVTEVDSCAVANTD